MRLLRVISSLNPSMGGPCAGIRAITPVLEAMGHTTDVACLDDASASYLRSFPAPVHALGPAQTSYLWTPRLRPWLVQNANRFDAVVVHGLWQFPGLATRSALGGGSTPYVVYPHGMLDPWFKRRYPLKHLKKWLYWPWGEYRILRDARMVLFTSEEERQQARHSFWLYRCNEQVVSYGTAAPPANDDNQRSAFLGEHPALLDRRFLLFLSRIHEKKGCDLLIRAYTELHRKNPKSLTLPDLVIAGPCADPAYLQFLKHLATAASLTVSEASAGGAAHSPGMKASGAGPLIHFLPMLSGAVKWGAFRTADAFILPSHQENFGIAVAEALSCGAPVLISDKVNIWREIESDRAGLAAPDDLSGTVKLMSAWEALPPEERNKMRCNARHCFDTRFEIHRAAESLLACLGRV